MKRPRFFLKISKNFCEKIEKLYFNPSWFHFRILKMILTAFGSDLLTYRWNCLEQVLHKFLVKAWNILKQKYRRNFLKSKKNEDPVLWPQKCLTHSLVIEFEGKSGPFSAFNQFHVKMSNLLKKCLKKITSKSTEIRGNRSYFP